MDTLQRAFSLLLFFNLILVVTGCGSDGNERREAYLDADYYTRLELPPDLTTPDNTKQLSAPEPDKAAIERFKRESEHLGEEGYKEAKKVVPIAVNVDGARIRTADGLFWLDIDEDAKTLWPHLKTFWDNEGVRVVRNDSILGIIETDWVSRFQVDEDAGFFTRLFSRIESDRLDKFRMRVESAGSKNTRIYVTHSGLEKSVEGDDINWRARVSEEELEREILLRLALYVGLDQKQFDKVYAQYRPYANRVKVSTDDSNVLYVTGTIDIVWKLTLRAIERMGFTIIETDPATHKVKVGIIKQTNEELGIEEDELAESSWLMQWLIGDENADDEDRQFFINHTAQQDVVRLDILESNNEVPDSVLAEQFIRRLVAELR